MRILLFSGKDGVRKTSLGAARQQLSRPGYCMLVLSARRGVKAGQVAPLFRSCLKK
jgi:hypothetical protein